MRNQKIQTNTGDYRRKANLSLLVNSVHAPRITTTYQDINNCIEFMLKPSQQMACDRATD